MIITSYVSIKSTKILVCYYGSHSDVITSKTLRQMALRQQQLNTAA